MMRKMEKEKRNLPMLLNNIKIIVSCYILETKQEKLKRVLC